MDTELKSFLSDEAVIKAIMIAAQETFYEMCRLPTDFDSSSIVINWVPIGSCTGIVKLQTESQLGQLQIHFSESAIFSLMAKLLGRSPMQVNSEALDCAGALTGVIYGRMKAILNPIGYNFVMAIPEMSYTVKLAAPVGDFRHLIIPFRIANSKSYIQIMSDIL